MKPFIRIKRYPYEEPYHLNLVVAASNGRQRGELEVYANSEDLGTLAADLRKVPRRGEDPAIWELGSERPEDRFAFYFRLRALQTDATGRCHVELKFNNNQAPPEREVVGFSLEAYPADLDKLADLLERFGKMEHQVLEWNVTEGQLH